MFKRTETIPAELADIIRQAETFIENRRLFLEAERENQVARPILEQAVETAKRQYGDAEAQTVLGGSAGDATKAKRALEAARSELEALDCRVAALRSKLADSGALAMLQGRLSEGRNR